MLITLYCNPFFPACKEKIYKIPCFFQKNFKREPKQAEDPAKRFPEKGKNRAQETAEGAFPQENAGAEGYGVGHSGVTAAKTEDQKNPDLEKSGHKQQIPQPAGAEGPQEAVKNAQTAAQHQRLPKVQRTAHLKKRCQKPAGRGSS